MKFNLISSELYSYNILSLSCVISYIQLFNSIFIIDDKIKKLRDLICIISATDLLIAASTGPLHLASALKVKTIGLFCHRRMSCVQHWGALGNNAVNIEVSKEYCDNKCSADKEICNFENGISVDEVLKSI